MGVADALPGISGGTIALLVGIYEELISTIGSLNFKLFKEIQFDPIFEFNISSINCWSFFPAVK